MRSHDVEWDDPEAYPDDEEEDAEPGAPPAEVDKELYLPVLAHDPVFKPDPDRRRRRAERITDYLKTREYTEHRKHVLREQRDQGRFA